MSRQAEQSPNRSTRTLERAIVLQVLRDDREPHWPRAQLAAQLAEQAHQPGRAARSEEPVARDAVLLVDSALAQLEGEGVLSRDGEAVRASRATRRLDALDLIAV
jgi:hypothetical protein